MVSLGMTVCFFLLILIIWHFLVLSFISYQCDYSCRVLKSVGNLSYPLCMIFFGKVSNHWELIEESMLSPL